MIRLLAFVAAAALCACGAGPAASADGDARPVLVVQIDGLGPDLLDDYLRRPASRGADRALHRVLGATPAGGGEVRFTRAHRSTSPIPAPFDDEAVTAVVTDGGALLQGARHAGFGGDARDDAARVAAVAGAKSGRVMVRLGGLAAALQRDGVDAGLDALGRVDELLAPLLSQWPDVLPVVIVGTHGAVPLPDVTSRPPQLFAEHLGLPVERLTATGGLLRVRGGGVEVAAKLDALDFTTRVFVRAGDEMLLFDRDLGALRRCDELQFEAYGNRQLVPWTQEGDVVAEARRSPAHDFQAGAAPARVGVGGLSEAEGFAVVVTVTRGGGRSDLAQIPTYVRGGLLEPVVGAGEGGLLLVPGAPDLEGRWLFATLPDPVDAAVKYRADAIVLTDRVVVPGRLVADLGGPASFEAPLATASAQTIEALARFGRGLRAFQEGRFEAASEALSVGGPGLPASASDWRRLMHAWADARRVGGGERAPFPDDLEGWPAVVSTFAQRMLGSEDAPPLAEDASHPELRAAFAALVGDGRSPCVGHTWEERSVALSAADGFRKAGELTALARLQIPFGDLRPHDLATALGEVRRLRAAWLRPVVARRVLQYVLTHPDLAVRATAELDQAAEMLLLSLQADIAADTAPGFEARRVSRLVGLVDGLAARRPKLLRETIEMAIGDARGVAPRVVGAIVAQGGIASLLSPDLPQKLTDMLRFADEALVEVRARPVAELTVDERVARVVAEALRAVLRGLEGNLPGAELALHEARELLRGADLLAARDAALAAVADDPDATPAPAAWGPYALLGVEATRAALALVTGRRGAARERVDAFLDFGAAFARHALAKAGHLDALSGHVDALVAGLRGLSVALIEGDPEGLKALGKLSLRVPDGPAADVGRWFVVAGVLARDAVWLVDTFGERPADDRLLTDATAAFDQLTATWPADSLVGQGALLVLKAAQRSVRDLPAVLATSDDLRAALAAAPHLLRALDTLHRDLRAAHPDAELRARIRDEDAPELALLDRLIVLLEAGPATWVDPDAVIAVMEARNRLVVEALKDRDGSVVRSLLAFERVNLLGAAGETDDALRWAKTGRAWSADVPAFAGHAYVWDLLAGRVARRAGKTAARDAAYAAAVETCPVLVAEIELARGLDSKQPDEARKHFEAARRAADEAGRGALSARLTLDVADAGTVVNAVVELPVLETLAGRGTGALQLGLGRSSTVEDHHGVRWALAPTADPAALALESLTWQAWKALGAGDTAAVDAALSRMVALWHGVDVGLLDPLDPYDPRNWGSPSRSGAPGASGKSAAGAGITTFPLPPGTPRAGPPAVRAPLELAWVLTLAELRGHTRLAGQVAGQVLPRPDWPTPPLGVEDVCGDRPPPAPPEGAPEALSASFCSAPSALAQGLKPAAARALARLINLRIARAVGAAEDERAWRAALKESARQAPTWVPAWVARQKPPAAVVAAAAPTTPEAAEAAIAGGFACEIALAESERPVLPPARTADVAADCAPVPFRVVALLRALDAGADLATLTQALDLAASMPTIRDQALPLAWDLAWRRLTAPGVGDRAKWASEVRWRAARAHDGAVELRFEALAIADALLTGKASEPLDPAWTLGEARREGLERTPAGLFLKRVVFGPAEQREAAARTYLETR